MHHEEVHFDVIVYKEGGHCAVTKEHSPIVPLCGMTFRPANQQMTQGRRMHHAKMLWECLLDTIEKMNDSDREWFGNYCEREVIRFHEKKPPR